jgi:putative phage-type endonuclease
MAPIILECAQKSDEWFSAICGNVGASSIDKIITTKGEPSKSRTDYMMTLAAERITGKGEVGFTSQAMLNGIEREAEARTLFEMARGVEIQQVGCVFKDERKLCHCSPDGLIGDNSGFEVKNPMSKTHIKYLLEGKLPLDYFCQVQFSLYVTERSSWWFMSHYPGIKPFMVEVYRDEKWISKMEIELTLFNDQLEDMVKQLI